MYIYDEANKLAKLIQQSDEYKQFKELRDKVFENETSKALLKDYKKLQIAAQSQYMAGKDLDAETSDKLSKISQVLQFNPDALQYMLAEHKFYGMLGDIYKILGDAAEVDLSFLVE